MSQWKHIDRKIEHVMHSPALLQPKQMSSQSTVAPIATDFSVLTPSKSAPSLKTVVRGVGMYNTLRTLQHFPLRMTDLPMTEKVLSITAKIGIDPIDSKPEQLSQPGTAPLLQFSPLKVPPTVTTANVSATDGDKSTKPVDNMFEKESDYTRAQLEDIEMPLFGPQIRMYADNTFFHVHQRQTLVMLFPKKFINDKDLYKWLIRGGVDASKFGRGAAKPISSLHAELKNGESTLRLKRDPVDKYRHEVLRTMHVTNLVIFGPNMKTCLVEKERHFLKTGRIQKKGKMPSIKMTTSELPPQMFLAKGVQQAAVTCLQKELSFKRTNAILKNSSIYSSITYRTSESMPGIKGEYHIHQFRIAILKQVVDSYWKEAKNGHRRSSTGKETELGVLKHIVDGRPFQTTETTSKQGTVVHHWDWKPIEQCMDKAAMQDLMKYQQAGHKRAQMNWGKAFQLAQQFAKPTFASLINQLNAAKQFEDDED